MSRPCASTALPYSSTATLTILATRRAGCSWAAAGAVAQSAPSSVKRLRTVVILIAEEIYRDCRGRARSEIGATLQMSEKLRNTPSSQLPRALRNDLRRHHVLGVRDRKVNAIHAKLARPGLGSAMQHEHRGLAALRNDLEFSPPDRLGEVVPRESLVRRLLGRNPRGGPPPRAGRRGRVRELAEGEEALQGPLALALEQLPHALDLDHVDADTDDHRAERSNQRGAASRARRSANNRASP